MSQHQIDLLPDAIRARSQAGVLAARYVTAAALTALVIIILATITAVRLDHARSRLQRAEARANLVLANETKAASLQARLDELRAYIQQYERVALPLEVSRLVATIINELPASVTLDRMELKMEVRRATPRTVGVASSERPPRRLLGEISGFASSDPDVTQIVSRLGSMPPFQDVRLMYTKSREVHGRAAREFSVSYLVDLDSSYMVMETAPLTQAMEGGDGN